MLTCMNTWCVSVIDQIDEKRLTLLSSHYVDQCITIWTQSTMEFHCPIEMIIVTSGRSCMIILHINVNYLCLKQSTSSIDIFCCLWWICCSILARFYMTLLYYFIYGNLTFQSSEGFCALLTWARCSNVYLCQSIGSDLELFILSVLRCLLVLGTRRQSTLAVESFIK